MSYSVKRLLVALAIFVGSVAAMLALSTLRPPPDIRPVDVTAPLVEIVELSPETVRFAVESQGTVQPLTQTALSAEVAGTIVSMSDGFVAGGSFVAGEVLLRIDPTNYEVAVERAEATVSQRQIEFDGAKKLSEQGYRSSAELASAKAALAAARADLVGAERDLQRTVVRVPYNGLVRERSAQLGDFVSPGTRLGTVFATDVAEVRLPMPDNDLRFVELPDVTRETTAMGPAVSFSGQYHGKPASWRGQIVRTEGVVDERNRMVFAVARIDDPYLLADSSENSKPLPVGTFVKADVDGITVDDVLKIPRGLVRGNNQVIFVDDEQQLRFRALEFLRADAEFAYVLAEQVDERRVLVTKLEAPLNGMKVRTGEDVQSAQGDDDTNDAPSGIASAGGQ
ncbi:MAG: efflux RND transporter periplasmic adaptor subunit [Pseudomonadota bacterium]